MKNLKLELGALVLVAAAGPGSALADPPPADPPQAQPSEDEPIACPVPGQTGAQAQANVQTPQQTAMAQPQPGPSPYPPPPSEAGPVYHERTWVEDVGVGLSIGGGVDDVSGSTLRNTTGTGGSWTARLTFGTHSYIAGEASYIGSAQSITALGLSTNSTLIGNGAQAALRLNGTIDYPVQPFVYGGAAWRHYSLSTSGTNFSDVSSSTDAFEIPVGIGVGGYIDQLMLDVRGEYRFAWVDHDLIAGTGNPLMDRWGVTGNIGYEF